MKTVIRIGTRSSELALWQAHTVSDQLRHLGHDTEIVKIDSIGDEVLNKPLYELGTTGVFTKNLDIALLNERIDIAVHSLKDVPTQLPKGIVQAAILKRGNHQDILVLKNNEEFFSNRSATIATGSQRRKAQWLYRFPNHRITGLRGNVNTRLSKLRSNDWDGAIFALAGLKRIGILPKAHLKLDWMLPAPAQGAVMIAALEKDKEVLEICEELNDKETEICVGLEREFLRRLEGGCSAPIGALAQVRNEELTFRGALFSLDGSKKIEFSKTVPMSHISDLAEFAAEFILDRGGKKLMRQIGQVEKKYRIFSTKNLSIVQSSELNQDIGVDMSDFITIRHHRIKPADLKKKLGHVIITSQNAVESLIDSSGGSKLDLEKIYCVGRRTKRLIEKRIGKVSHTANSARKLAEHLAAEFSEPREFTFFCGDLRRDELPRILKSHGHTVNEVVSYQTLFTPDKLNPGYQGILFFSPSGIQSYLKENSPGDEVAFCIGSTTADAARTVFNSVVEAKNPSVEAVIQSVNDYYQPKPGS
jgi:hydroxymethylbilane synthase